ncbi:MAG: PDZ domain-containing protein [Rhodocyclaceae bacterium]|nr:PDZ domain-containing protein [Rhodocyclaceae bacterium]
MPRIFVSYRRLDSAGHSGRLCDALIRNFGRGSLFLDIDNMQPGDDFVRILEERVRRTDVFLAIIGPRWASACDESGRRRIELPDDFVRMEIVSALQCGIPVIPVLVGGATVPSADQLPEDLKRLPRLHACEVGDLRFRQDVLHLVRAIDQRLGATARGWLTLFRLRYAAAVLSVAAVLAYWMLALDVPRAIPTPGDESGSPGRSGLEIASEKSAPGSSNLQPGIAQTDGPFLSFGTGDPQVDVATMRLKREVDRLAQIKELLRDFNWTSGAVGTIGVVLAEVPGDARAYIASIIGDGPGGKAGLRAGDVVDAVNGRHVEDWHDIELAVMQAQIGSTLMISVRRGSRELAFPVVVAAMGAADIAERSAQVDDRLRSILRTAERASRAR